MSEHLFGLGSGWLPSSADAIARRHGAELVNYTDSQCQCGYGCGSGKCKSSRRHWFAGRNRGNPYDQQMAAAVMSEVCR